MPVFVVSLPLVDVVAEDGGATAELGHLPTQDHGVAVTVQEGDPVRMGRDGCRKQRESCLGPSASSRPPLHGHLSATGGTLAPCPPPSCPASLPHFCCF